MLSLALLALVVLGCGPAATPPPKPVLPSGFYESGTLSYKITLPDGNTKVIAKVTGCDAISGTWSNETVVFVVQCKTYAYTIWAGLATELEIVK